MKELSQHAAFCLYEAAKDALHAMRTGNSEVSAINKLTAAIDLADRETTVPAKPLPLVATPAGNLYGCSVCGEVYHDADAAAACCQSE